MLVRKYEDPDEDSSLHEETGQLLCNSAVLMLDTEVNIKRREIYEVINKWVRNYIENRSYVLHIDTPPLHLFITGSVGFGKSHLIKTVYHSLTKTLCLKYCSLHQLVLQQLTLKV